MDRMPLTHKDRVSDPVNHRAWFWRRAHTRRLRRCVAGAMAFLGTTGMLLQQTHADYYLVHGFPATRDFISVTPSLLEVARERLAATTRTILDNWRIVADRPGAAAEGGTAQAPAVRHTYHVRLVNEESGIVNGNRSLQVLYPGSFHCDRPK